MRKVLKIALYYILLLNFNLISLFILKGKYQVTVELKDKEIRTLKEELKLLKVKPLKKKIKLPKQLGWVQLLFFINTVWWLRKVLSLATFILKAVLLAVAWHRMAAVLCLLCSIAHMNIVLHNKLIIWLFDF